MKKHSPFNTIVSLITFLLLICTTSAFAADTGGITGTLNDQRGNPIINAVVNVLQGRTKAGSGLTDFDGNYIVKPLKSGVYTVQFVYLNNKQEVTAVQVEAGKLTTVNTKMTVANTGAKDVVVTVKRYEKPLIDFKAPPHGMRTADEIQRAPTISKLDMAALTSQGYRAKSGQSISIGGSRTSGTTIIVDGVQLSSGAPQYFDPSNEQYKKDAENDFKTVKASPRSTLSVDVDRASYSNIRRFINQGQKPPADAVRIEEMVNYFGYNYPQPTGNDPVAVFTEVTACPWNPEKKLLHIGIQARKVATDKLPPSNLVFLIDVSGSMDEPNKLPLLKSSLKLLVNNLRAQDRVSIVVYAGNAGLVLPSTSGNKKQTIIDALDNLSAGGSTAGGEGILLAYRTAEEHFIKGGNNRIILATDGDFNVGVSNDNDLETLITQQRSKGIFLTCLGYGMGNYKDSKMEVLADKGNGNYAYIDNIQEAQKTLVREFGGTLFTVAKDVKAQVEFNPAKVQGYRLVGYENRLLNTEDFKDDTKDAGEMGAGHTVTILYEIVPTGVKSKWLRDTDGLKYQQVSATDNTAGDVELATVKFRYKAPDGNVSKEMTHPIADEGKPLLQTSDNIRFAAAVAMWGMLLKDSKYKGKSNYHDMLLLAESARGKDKDGDRAECIRLMKSVSMVAFDGSGR